MFFNCELVKIGTFDHSLHRVIITDPKNSHKIADANQFEIIAHL